MSEELPKVTVRRGIFGDISGALLFQRDRLQKPGQISLSTTAVSRNTAVHIYAARLDGSYAVDIEIPDAIHAIEGLRGQASSLELSAEKECDLYREIALNQAQARRDRADQLIVSVLERYVLTDASERELSAQHSEQEL